MDGDSSINITSDEFEGVMWHPSEDSFSWASTGSGKNWGDFVHLTTLYHSSLISFCIDTIITDKIFNEQEIIRRLGIPCR